MAHPIGVKFNAGPDILALTAAKTLTVEDSGKLITLGTAGGFAVTLPAVADSEGVNFKFVVKVSPTTAYTVVTASSENVIHGNVVSSGGGATTVAAASDTITFVASTAIIGDTVELFCDGTYWYCRGECDVDGGVTLSQAS